jgi:hypothetical protein
MVRVIRDTADQKAARVKYFLDRFLKMDSTRQEWESEWHYTDAQVKATVSKDPKWKLLVNVPIERALEDINVGKYSWSIPFDVTWMEGSPDVNRTQPLYYAMNDYMDRENFFFQKDAMIRDKGRYWSAIAYTAVRYNSYLKYEPTEIANGLYCDDMKEILRKEYKFSPMNRPIYNVWFDDQAMNQWDQQKITDCILEEHLTPEEVKMNWQWVSGVDVNSIKAYPVQDPEYGKYNAYPNQCVISYYYNRVTSDWDVVLNKREILYSGKYFHNGTLPVELVQHFPNNSSLYGEGIAHRIRGMKWYKKSILQDILDASKMSAGINIIVPENVDVNARVWSGINVWSTSWGVAAGWIQPVQFQTRINDMVAVLSLVDDYLIQDVGENIKAPYTSPKTTLGEIEVMEEKQQMRDRGIEAKLNYFYDGILTKFANNIATYAVSLKKMEWTTKIKWPDGEEREVEQQIFPSLNIKVKDKKVEKKKDWEWNDYLEFTDDFGKEWAFDLSETNVKWEFLSKIQTPSTKISNAVQKESFMKWLQWLQTLTAIFSSMWINLQPIIEQELNPTSIIQKWKQLYEIDPKLVPQSRKNMMDAEIKKEQDLAQVIMWWNPLHGTIPTDAQTPQNPVQQTPQMDI